MVSPLLGAKVTKIGANKGLEPFDLYGEAEDYERKLREKAEKAKKKEADKAKKIAKDKEIREKKGE